MQLLGTKTITGIDDKHDVVFVTMKHKDTIVNVHVGHNGHSVLVSSDGEGTPVTVNKLNNEGMLVYFNATYAPMLNWYEHGEGLYVANFGVITLTVRLNVPKPFYIIETMTQQALDVNELPRVLDEEVTGTPFEDAEYALLEILGIDYVTANVD